MALVGIQVADLSLRHTVLLSTGQTPSPATQSRRSFPLRVTFSPLLEGRFNGRRSLRQTSGSTGPLVRAATATAGPPSDASAIEAASEDKKEATVELLACPVCYKPLSRKGISGINQRAISRSGFECSTCKKTYSSRNEYLDLTVTAKAKAYSENQAASTEIFRSGLVSFAYERGWRQNFRQAGFPGPDEEVKMAQKYLQPTYGGILLDVSCGSGLFTRRFANLDLFSSVIAIDFSENMLRQTYAYIKEDESLLDSSIALVRADVARLPFATGSVDAVHAGAALHCWPSPAIGVSAPVIPNPSVDNGPFHVCQWSTMAEISRILRPGGVFVATTFISRPSPLPTRIFQAVEPAATRSTYRYWQEAELEDLMTTSGLVNYERIRRRGFIMISGQKPE